MDNASNLVFQGREGTGAARIFGRPGDPFGELKGQQQRKAKDDAVQAELGRQAKKDRDEKINELLLADPDKTFEPFVIEVANFADEQRKRSVVALKNGVDPYSPEFTRKNKAGWDKVNSYAAKGNLIKDMLTQERESVQDHKYLDFEGYYSSKYNDSYLDDYGNGKNLDDVNVRDILSIKEDHKGFMWNDFTRDFMDDLESNVFMYHKERNDKMGRSDQNTRVKIQSTLFIFDESTESGVMEDENGDAIIRITPAFMSAFTADPYMKKIVEDKMQQSRLSKQEVIAGMVGPRAVHEKEQKTTFKEYSKDNISGYEKAEAEEFRNRLPKIHKVLHAFYDDERYFSNQPSTEAQRLLGELKGGKFNNQEIIDAQFVKGVGSDKDGKYGSSSIMGMAIENNKNDRIVFKVKTGTRSGRTQDGPAELDLTDPGTGAELNAIWNTSTTGGKGKVIDFQRMLDYNGAYYEQTGNNMFPQITGKTRGGTVDAAAENEQVGKWQKGKDLESLKGKYYNGKKIKDVLPTKSGGVLGIGSSVTSLDIQFEDGTAVDIPVEEYNKLASIYNSGRNSTGNSNVDDAYKVIK